MTVGAQLLPQLASLLSLVRDAGRVRLGLSPDLTPPGAHPAPHGQPSPLTLPQLEGENAEGATLAPVRPLHSPVRLREQN